MSETITVTGVVATEPRHVVTAEGLNITSFRLASTQRKYDKAEDKWVDGDTNWYTVSSFRQLAANAAASVLRGQRVLVTGRVRIREWAKDDRRGVTVDVEAESIGHDLAWGTSSFSRIVTSSASPAPDAAPTGEALSESPGASQVSEPVPF